MAEAPFGDDSHGHLIGPIVVEGETPRWVPLVYFVPMLVAGVCAGLVGPFHGWWAALAALLAMVVAYVAVALGVIAFALVRGLWDVWCEDREYKRDPRAFIEKRFGPLPPGTDPPA
jgi:hypothetical protein